MGSGFCKKNEIELSSVDPHLKKRPYLCIIRLSCEWTFFVLVVIKCIEFVDVEK